MADSDKQASEAAEIAVRIYPMLAGRDPSVQGAVLADLVAMFLAGHQGEDAEELRETLLNMHIALVRELLPVNAAMMMRGER